MVVGVDWYGMGFPSARLGVGVFGLAVGVFWRCRADWGRG